MIRLNCSASGKPRDLTVTVIKVYSIHTCDEDPKDAVEEAFRDGTLEEMDADSIDLKIDGIDEEVQ